MFPVSLRDFKLVCNQLSNKNKTPDYDLLTPEIIEELPNVALQLYNYNALHWKIWM